MIRLNNTTEAPRSIKTQPEESILALRLKEALERAKARKREEAGAS